MAPRLPRALAALALAGGLVGCSGTPFGDQLARSFSAPPAAAPAPAAPSAAARPARPPAQPLATPATSPRPAAQPTLAPRPSVAAGPPAPYRITLRLPGADPSAPAELVTEALRAAGVSFEVEMIERVRAGDGAGSAPPVTTTPAPAPR